MRRSLRRTSLKTTRAIPVPPATSGRRIHPRAASSRRQASGYISSNHSTTAALRLGQSVCAQVPGDG
jgi:hypothetical protein